MKKACRGCFECLLKMLNFLLTLVDGAWSRPLYGPKRDRKPKSNNDFYYY